jgi:hypothetical protein
VRRRSCRSALLRLTMAVGPFPAWSFPPIQSDAARLESARLTGRWAVALAVTAWFSPAKFDGPEWPLIKITATVILGLALKTGNDRKP